MATLVNLRNLLEHEIDDLYSAEEQIIEALPKMVEKAVDHELKKALNKHLQVTKKQKERLDKVKRLLNQEKPKEGFFEKLFGGTKCKGTEGLIKEGEKMMGEDMDETVMDAAIIASARKIEHYEISGYGTARTYARELGLNEIADLLESTLKEEYQADDQLTSLATRKINPEAEVGGDTIENKDNRNTDSGERKRDVANRSNMNKRQDAKKAKSAGLKNHVTTTNKKAATAVKKVAAATNKKIALIKKSAVLTPKTSMKQAVTRNKKATVKKASSENKSMSKKATAKKSR